MDSVTRCAARPRPKSSAAPLSTRSSSARCSSDGSAEGDGVYLKSRDRQSSYVHGYGIPDFSDDVVLADPEWKGRPGAVYFGQEASESDLSGDSGTAVPGTGAAPDAGYEPFPGADFFQPRPEQPGHHPHGRAPGGRGLLRLLREPRPGWSDADGKSFRNWQHKLGDSGDDEDGIPGPRQWAALQVPRG
ncbi:hypothetical protein ACIQ9Q_42355 [Streptomyces sp. NPDC094438]|uniref:hypothetical protein n=1 Tax=Streptomyces sp. NPDC094438 TaxID=3366061 RepID=UPI003805DE45